jgi:hypothetical protein
MAPGKSSIDERSRRMSMSNPRIGYAPFSADFSHPADRRRFVAYARSRHLNFEIARPSERYDLVVLSEVADINVWSQYRHGKVVFDLIDSYLAVPATDPKQLLRGLVWFANGRHSRFRLNFKAALERQCLAASAVICTTDAQLRDISRLNRNVYVILDAQDDVARVRKTNYDAVEPIRLVWEGLPSNLFHLRVIGSVLRDLAKQRPLVLNIVTEPSHMRFLGRFGRVESIDIARQYFDQVVYHRWEAATLSSIVTSCDIAVIPIDLTDALGVGKPANKLLLFWRMAMPVITSRTAVYQETQRGAGLEHLACGSDTDWQNALVTLMTSERERREAGERGYAFVTENFSYHSFLRSWDQVFTSLGFDFTPKAVD